MQKEQTLRSKLVRDGVMMFITGCNIALISIHLAILLDSLGYSPSNIGKLLSIYSISGLCAILIISRIVGTRLSYFQTAASTLIAGFSSFLVLSFSRNFALSAAAIMVFSLGFFPQISLMDSYLTEKYKGSQFRYYAKLRSMTSLGYIFALLMVGSFHILSPFKAHTLLVLLAVTFSAHISLYYLNTRDLKLVKTKEEALEKEDETARPTGIEYLGWPLVLLLLGLLFIWGIVMGVNSNFLPLYIRNNLGHDNVSFVYVLATSSEVPVLFFSQRILYRRKISVMLLLAYSAALVRILSYALLPFYSTILGVQLLHSLAYALFHASFFSIITRYFHKYRNLAIGIYTATIPLSGAISSFIGGYIVENVGYTSLFFSYFFAGLIIFIPIAMLWEKMKKL